MIIYKSTSYLQTRVDVDTDKKFDVSDENIKTNEYYNTPFKKKKVIM